MKIFRITLALLMLFLLFAGSATAIDEWTTEPGADDLFPCDFQKSRSCWWDVTEAGSLDVTTVLDAHICENLSVRWYNNIAAATYNNIAAVYSNANKFTISATNLFAEKVRGLDLTGDPTASGDLFAIYGFDSSYVYVRFTMVDVGSTGRIEMQCHPRGKN